jgi:hypothetical protein
MSKQPAAPQPRFEDQFPDHQVPDGFSDTHFNQGGPSVGNLAARGSVQLYPESTPREVAAAGPSAKRPDNNPAPRAVSAIFDYDQAAAKPAPGYQPPADGEQLKLIA